MQRTKVYVYAADPVTQAGIATQLRYRPEIALIDEPEVDQAQVALIASDELDEETLRVVRAVQRNGCPRVVLVTTQPTDVGLLAAVEAGAKGLLKRKDATTETLIRVIEAAATGDGSVPPDLLGRLLTQVGNLQRHVLSPRGLTFAGLTERELDVLRLVADGHDTPEIAKQLSYSERTIKNVIHDITMRLNLRNRTHAVAFAMRQGLI